MSQAKMMSEVPFRTLGGQYRDVAEAIYGERDGVYEASGWILDAEVLFLKVHGDPAVRVAIKFEGEYFDTGIEVSRHDPVFARQSDNSRSLPRSPEKRKREAVIARRRLMTPEERHEQAIQEMRDIGLKVIEPGKGVRTSKKEPGCYNSSMADDSLLTAKEEPIRNSGLNSMAEATDD